MSHRLPEAKRRQSFYLYVVDLKKPRPKRVATIELEAENLLEAVQTVRDWYGDDERFEVRSGR